MTTHHIAITITAGRQRRPRGGYRFGAITVALLGAVALCALLGGCGGVPYGPIAQSDQECLANKRAAPGPFFCTLSPAAERQWATEVTPDKVATLANRDRLRMIAESPGWAEQGRRNDAAIARWQAAHPGMPLTETVSKHWVSYGNQIALCTQVRELDIVRTTCD